MDLRTNLNRFVLLLDEKAKDSPAKARELYHQLKEDFWQLFGPLMTPLPAPPTKPYFAKFMPTSGEIEEGDFGFAPDGKVTYFNKARAKHFGPECTKAKLVICTRNVKEDDEVSDSRGNKKTIRTQKELNKFLVLINSGELVKVIGEPSPEAKWITEGQEFDKDDLMAHGYGMNWTDDHKNLRFKIKGPCGYFH